MSLLFILIILERWGVRNSSAKLSKCAALQGYISSRNLVLLNRNTKSNCQFSNRLIATVASNIRRLTGPLGKYMHLTNHQSPFAENGSRPCSSKSGRNGVSTHTARRSLPHHPERP